MHVKQIMRRLDDGQTGYFILFSSPFALRSVYSSEAEGIPRDKGRCPAVLNSTPKLLIDILYCSSNFIASLEST